MRALNKNGLMLDELTICGHYWEVVTGRRWA
jgi:hypothetical protein